MSTDYFCKLCDIACTGKAPYEQHIHSAKHMKKAILNETQLTSEQVISSNTKIPSSPKLNTQPLSPITNNNTSEDPPLASASITPETMRILLEWHHPLGYKPYCDICQLPLHGGDNAEIHYSSSNKLHSQKLAAWKQIRENDARYSCKVCSEIFQTENIMREHFNSDAHATVIQRRNSLEKFIQIYETYQKLKQVRKQAKESSSAVDDTLANEFEKLNVIDVSEPKEKSTKNWGFNFSKLEEVMSNSAQDDE